MTADRQDAHNQLQVSVSSTSILYTVHSDYTSNVSQDVHKIIQSQLAFSLELTAI